MLIVSFFFCCDLAIGSSSLNASPYLPFRYVNMFRSEKLQSPDTMVELLILWGERGREGGGEEGDEKREEKGFKKEGW